jgi:hypothetical protein
MPLRFTIRDFSARLTDPLPAVWGTAMKRPQFSLRLMLLLIALAATIFGWRAAIERKEQEDQNSPDSGILGLLNRCDTQINERKAELFNLKNSPQASLTPEEAEKAIRECELDIEHAKAKHDWLLEGVC